ncbi:MAG: putative RNA methyltransferase [Propionibacteriaceae bacterium]
MPAPGLDTVLDLLACPHCGGALTAHGPTLVCPDGHAFDVARQGYVNLLPRAAPASADTAAMVSARERFLDTGGYDPVLTALDQAIGDGSVLVDAGAGPGWYLQRLLAGRAGVRGLALDISVPAVRRAARRHPRLGAAVADTWRQLPVRDAVADVMLSVFAPRNPAEFARVLRPGGRLVVVAAQPDHLARLRDRFGLLAVEPDKQQRLESGLAAAFEVVEVIRVAFPLTLDPAMVRDLIGMGPNAFHPTRTRPPDGPLEVTAAVGLTVARLRP